jgi:ABC-2 type transport system permease protein
VSGALRYEVVRLRTLRSTWWLLGISLVLSAGIAVALAFVSQENDLGIQGQLSALTTGSGLFFPVPAIMAGLVGVFSFGHEYRYGTIRAALSAVPKRSALLLAKVVVTAVWAAVMAALDLGLAWLSIRLVPDQTLFADGFPLYPVGRVMIGFVLLLVLWSLCGLALAGLFRNLPATLVVLLVFPLLGEQILSAILGLVDAFDDIAWWMKYLPFGAGQAMLQVPAFFDGAPDGFYVASPLQGGLTFAAFTAALLVITGVLFQRRDA